LRWRREKREEGETLSLELLRAMEVSVPSLIKGGAMLRTPL
jgi:hypothetical protein